MNSEFVYKQVLTGSLKKGASQTQSKNMAVMASEKYKKGSYNKKVLDLINDHINLAVKMTVGKKGKHSK